MDNYVLSFAANQCLVKYIIGLQYAQSRFMLSFLSIIIGDNSRTLFIITDYHLKALKTSIKLGYEYIFIPIIITEKTMYTHINILLYNTVKNEMERFDPHYTYMPLNNMNDIDDVIEAKYRTILDSDFVYIRPYNYMNILNINNIKNTEFHNMCNDCGGYCIMWAMWYIIHRINNKHITRDVLIQKLYNKLSCDYDYIMQIYGKLITLLKPYEYINHLSHIIHMYKPYNNDGLLYATINKYYDIIIADINI